MRLGVGDCDECEAKGVAVVVLETTTDDAEGMGSISGEHKVCADCVEIMRMTFYKYDSGES